jgi:hypothetical protein
LVVGLDVRVVVGRDVGFNVGVTVGNVDGRDEDGLTVGLDVVG